MPLTEAKKRANAKWNGENIATLACSVRKEKADAFRKKCKENGKTVNGVLLSFVDSYLDESPAPEGTQA